jgi:beta-galactosidase
VAYNVLIIDVYAGEHDFGGFPSYLLTVPDIELRTNNTAYLYYVDRWWNVLFPIIKQYLYTFGGPITSVQIENEFGRYHKILLIHMLFGLVDSKPTCAGSYGDTGGNPADLAYMRHLKTFAHTSLGSSNVLLYTTDGGDAGYLSHGALPGEVFATGDFGPTLDPQSNFAAQDQFNPAGWRAHIDSEYYPGWLTHWGEQMANISSLSSAGGVSVILSLNASVDLYMVWQASSLYCGTHSC